MFFSKQFFMRSYHEILTQGVVLATLRRHHLGSHLWFLFESPWSAVSFVSVDLQRQKRKKTRKGIPQGINWKFNFHHFTKLNNSFEKKNSSEHCIRRIICTQMVILICKMSVILSEIPVSVSPYYNPNVSFISLSSFKNYDPQLEKNSPEV